MSCFLISYYVFFYLSSCTSIALSRISKQNVTYYYWYVYHSLKTPGMRYIRSTYMKTKILISWKKKKITYYWEGVANFMEFMVLFYTLIHFDLSQKAMVNKNFLMENWIVYQEHKKPIYSNMNVLK